MRDFPDTYRLTFMLPASLVLLVQPGRHCPCLFGCVLMVDRSGLVSIVGPSRQQVFDQAGRFLRVHCKGRPALTIAATLQTPAAYVPGGRDGWSIIIGAQIAFSPTSIEPHIPAAEASCVA